MLLLEILLLVAWKLELLHEGQQSSFCGSSGDKTCLSEYSNHPLRFLRSGTTSQREWEKLPIHGFMVHAWY